MIWLLRLTWASLPLTAGPAAADALHGWATPSVAVANVLLWLAWAAVLLGVFAPRPLGLTALRAVAPAFLAVAIWTATRATAASATVAVAATAVTFVLGLSAPVAATCVNGAAYGDERRFPLAVPPGLFLGPLPLAVALVTVGAAAGPLLLADGRVPAGGLALVLGWPVAILLVRSLHSLSRRWAVLVPAGLVVVDRFTLADPVLFTRERVRALRPVDARVTVPRAAVDLRLGAARCSLRVELSHPVTLTRAARGRDTATSIDTDEVLLAPVRAAELLRVASKRRIPIGERRR